MLNNNFIAIFYITFPNYESAAKLGRNLVDSGLVACVNIFQNMTSIYKWEGEICEEQECVMILKTKKNLSDELMAEIIKLHPYDIPCIIELKVDSVNDSYLQWIVENSR